MKHFTRLPLAALLLAPLVGLLAAD